MQRLWGWLPLASVAEEHAPATAVGEGEEMRARVAAAFAELPVAQREVCSLRPPIRDRGVR